MKCQACCKPLTQEETNKIETKIFVPLMRQYMTLCEDCTKYYISIINKNKTA